MSKYFPIDSYNGILDKTYTSLINNSIKISHRVLFNCTSISDSFLALGCNTGNIYLFTIDNDKFKYFSNIISNDTAIDHLQFSPSKSYLAYSNVKSQIFVYKLNLITETAHLIRQIDSSLNSLIHSLLWDEENSRIFCGYKNGTVDSVYIPQAKDIFHFPSENILKSEKQSLIQMDFIKDTLLVSTNEKVVLINLLSKFSILIGTKQRLGQYGACFWLGERKNLKVIAARPNYRIWIADIDGTVEETQQYLNPINSFKYEIRPSGDDLPGTGQFSWLSPVKNNVIFAGDTGLIFLIDLVVKSCLIKIDCGTNLTKTIYSGTGVTILNFQKEINHITITTMKDALVQIINENIDTKYAIDVFLSLNQDSEFYQNTKCEIDIRKIFNSFHPNLLSLIVQKAAELEYKFAETNQLQVDITDNEEYQKTYYSMRIDHLIPIRNSNSNSTDITMESSNDLSIGSNNSQSLNKPSLKKRQLSDKIRNVTKTPQLFQVIYDKTTKFISQMEISSSNNSEMNLIDLISHPNSYDNIDQNNSISLKQSSTNIISENSGATLNLMELEANVYIAWERMKQLSNAEEINSQNDFLDSLSNFCESWLILNLQHWQNLFSLELHVRNLSATFPNFSLKSTEGLVSSDIAVDIFIPHEQFNYLYENSWSCTISTSEWMKPLVISEKIMSMTSILLSYCFSYGIFSYFPALIQEINNITNMEKFQLPLALDNFDLEPYDSLINKSIQTDVIANVITSKTTETLYQFPDLLEMLINEIWPMEPDQTWIKSMILLFHSATNLTELRSWLRSCISQDIWITIVNCLIEIHSSIFNKEKYRVLSPKSQIELDELLFNCLCLNSIDSLLYADKILEVMKQRGTINWKIIIESENLNCREVLHLSIKHNLDLSSYISYLFNFINLSAKFYSRNQLIEYIYSEFDVLISFVYTLLSNRISDKVKPQTCSCGMIIIYTNSNLPEYMHQIVIEILKWGSDQNVFKSNSKLLELMTKICIDMGFHQGYVELLVGTCNIKMLIQIGLQTSNIQILERIKDCVLMVKQSLKQAIEFIIYFHRKHIFDHCLHCDQIIENCHSRLAPLSFKDIGELIFNKLIDKNNYQEIHHSIIKMLTITEVNQVKEYFIAAIKNIINSKKVIVKNQMFNFITTEINQIEESSKLTEMFLNIYGMNYSELCGANWGKILTQNMHCDICGAILIGKMLESDKVDIVSFSCSHTFHKKCLQEIGCDYICFIC